MTPIFVSSNPQEPTDWRAVCGRTARTVRREGSRVTVLPYPYRRGSDGIPRWGSARHDGHRGRGMGDLRSVAQD